MASIFDIQSLREAYKAKRLEFTKLHDKWTADRFWAQGLERERGDYLGQVSKARRTPAGYNELKAELKTLGEHLKTVELASMPVLEVFPLMSLKKERKSIRDIKNLLATEWAAKGGALPVPSELLEADARIQELTVEMERTASEDYKALLLQHQKALSELHSFHRYYGVLELVSYITPHEDTLAEELTIYNSIDYGRKNPQKVEEYKAKGFWDVHDCFNFSLLCEKGLPASPFLYNQDDPRNYELPVEERLRVTGTPSLTKKPVDLRSLLAAATRKKSSSKSPIYRTVTTPLQHWQVEMMVELESHNKRVENAWSRAEASWNRIKPSPSIANKYATADPEVWEEVRVLATLGSKAWKNGATLEDVWAVAE